MQEQMMPIAHIVWQQQQKKGVRNHLAAFSRRSNYSIGIRATGIVHARCTVCHHHL